MDLFELTSGRGTGTIETDGGRLVRRVANFFTEGDVAFFGGDVRVLERFVRSVRPSP